MKMLIRQELALIPPNVGPCNVAGENCTSPPGGMIADFVKTECFGCGLNVCKKCSKFRRWYGYGRRRICDRCFEDDRRKRK